MFKFAIFFCELVLLSVFFQGAEAGVYKCLNAQQRVFYKDTPCQEMITAKLPSHLSQHDGEASNHYFLWKASPASAKGAVYLMGSLHLGIQDMYPLPASIMDAFNAADVLVVEANIQNPKAGDAAARLVSAGSFSDGSSMEDHVKPTTWRKLLETAKKLGVSEDSLRTQKPWLASLRLTAQAFKQAGFSEDLGVDQVFLKEAGGKKPILEMESIERQGKLFESFSEQEQEQLLLLSLQDLGKGPDFFKELVGTWKKGDAEAMNLITRHSFDNSSLSAKLFKVLFEDRNTAMADKIDELVGDGRTYFVVVGAGHLGGDQGILKNLENKGYRITQP